MTVRYSFPRDRNAQKRHQLYENIFDLFFDCPLAQSTLSWFQSLMFHWSCLAPSLECRHLLIGFNSHERRTALRVFCYLLNVVKYCLWLSRNDFHFHGIRPSAASAFQLVPSSSLFRPSVGCLQRCCVGD